MYSNQTVSLTPSFSRYSASLDVISVVHRLLVRTLDTLAMTKDRLLSCRESTLCPSNFVHLSPHGVILFSRRDAETQSFSQSAFSRSTISESLSPHGVILFSRRDAEFYAESFAECLFPLYYIRVLITTRGHFILTQRRRDAEFYAESFAEQWSWL